MSTAKTDFLILSAGLVRVNRPQLTADRSKTFSSHMQQLTDS